MKPKQPDDDEPETFFSRQHETLEDAGGRFAKQSQTRIINGGASYPTLPSTPLTSQAPDHGFHPQRDRIDEADVTSMTFGQALEGKSEPPPEVSSLPQAPCEEDAAPSASSSPLSKRRF